MKKIIIAATLIAGLSGCASSSRIDELESKVDAIGVYTANNSIKVDFAIVSAKRAEMIAEEARVEANSAVEAVNRMAEKVGSK